MLVYVFDVYVYWFQSFGDAYKLVEVTDKPGDTQAPYIVKNESGTDITVRPDESFKVSHCH